MWQLALVIRFEDVSNRNSLVVAAPGLEDGIGIGDGSGRVGEGESERSFMIIRLGAKFLRLKRRWLKRRWLKRRWLKISVTVLRRQ